MMSQLTLWRQQLSGMRLGHNQRENKVSESRSTGFRTLRCCELGKRGGSFICKPLNFGILESVLWAGQCQLVLNLLLTRLLTSSSLTPWRTDWQWEVGRRWPVRPGGQGGSWCWVTGEAYIKQYKRNKWRLSGWTESGVSGKNWFPLSFGLFSRWQWLISTTEALAYFLKITGRLLENYLLHTGRHARL